MKTLKGNISLLLLGSFLIAMVWQTIVVINFYVNRVEIAEKYCVNKDKPKMNCQGKCHLKKQLAEPKLLQNQPTKPLTTALIWLNGPLVNAEIKIQIENQSLVFFNPINLGKVNSYSDKTFLPPDFNV